MTTVVVSGRGPREALKAWGQSADEVTRTPMGSMNETYFAGRYVLRRHRTTDVSRLQWESLVIEHARRRGVPAPALVPALDGQTLVERPDGLWSLFERADGLHIQRGEMGEEAAHEMGASLAQVHVALEDLPAVRIAPPLSTSAAELHNTFRLLVAAVEGIDEDVAAARATRLWLRGFAAWHRRIGACDAPARRATQVVHGDSQDTNVLFAGDRVAAVIDWDKAEARMAVEEILRAMHLSFDLDAALCAAFLTGYRSGCRLPIDQIDVGARVYGFERDRSTWILEELYLRGNERVRSMVETMTGFVPFHERWADVRTVLVERAAGSRVIAMHP